MPGRAAKHKVELTAPQRRELEALCRQQHLPVSKARRARVLLLADESVPEGRRHDRDIAELVGLSERQVVRLRKQFVLGAALPVDRRPYPPRVKKIDGEVEARLITIACSTPPDGRACWTLELLYRELVVTGTLTSVCRETVRQALKKMRSSPGDRSATASPRRTGPPSLPIWNTSLMSTRNATHHSTR